MTESPPIWETFFKALSVEYRPHTEIAGDSGIMHQVEAIGVDDKTNRVVIVAAEHNPRSAALLRVDVQAMMPKAKILVARPLAIDIAYTSRSLFTTKSGGIDLNKVIELGTILGSGNSAQTMLDTAYGPTLKKLISEMGRSKLPLKSHILSVIEQIAYINWEKIKNEGFSDAVSIAYEVIRQFNQIDNLAEDRMSGICPVPIYELTEDDWELFASGKNVDEVRERLKALNIYQYFFPPADTVALGLIDRDIGLEEQIQRGFEFADQGGHIVTQNELIPDAKDLPELLEGLKSGGYIAEAEYSLETTEEGRTARQTIKVRPRESFVSRIVNRINISASFSPRDIFPSG